MYCAIYLNNSLDKISILNSLKKEFNITNEESSFITLGSCTIYVSNNSDNNLEKSKQFPDGFLYFKYIIDIESEEEIEKDFIIINKILDFFWKQNIPAIASYDHEELLKERGGYNNRNVPWGINL